MTPDFAATPRLSSVICDPGVRADMSERVFNPDVYEGHDGYRRFLGEIDAVWDDFRRRAAGVHRRR